MFLDPRRELLSSLSDEEYRQAFTSEHVGVGLAFQIRHMREDRGWTQEDLGQRTGSYERLEGTGSLDRVVLVDQSPIGRTPRSNPITYIRAFAALRQIYAAEPEARSRGLDAGDFSFNRPGGRCEVCKGAGEELVDMVFLADISVPCEACGGLRYRPEVLEVEVRGLDISEVLAREHLQKLRSPRAVRVAFQSPCSLQHAQPLGGLVERLLTDLGFELSAVPNAHLCCGSAGAYSMLQRDLSNRLRSDKIQALESGSPQRILTANIGCLAHLAAATDLEVRHWIEAVDATLA